MIICRNQFTLNLLISFSLSFTLVYFHNFIVLIIPARLRNRKQSTAQMHSPNTYDHIISMFCYCYLFEQVVCMHKCTLVDLYVRPPCCWLLCVSLTYELFASSLLSSSLLYLHVSVSNHPSVCCRRHWSDGLSRRCLSRSVSWDLILISASRYNTTNLFLPSFVSVLHTQ